jgi:hypothetical protein
LSALVGRPAIIDSAPLCLCHRVLLFLYVIRFCWPLRCVFSQSSRSASANQCRAMSLKALSRLGQCLAQRVLWPLMRDGDNVLRSRASERPILVAGQSGYGQVCSPKSPNNDTRRYFAM